MPRVDLADEQDQRRRILHRDVDAGRGVGRARAARDEADAGPAGELAVGLRHHRRAALLAADRDGDRGVVQRVEHGEIALARHAEDVLDAVRRELVDEDLAAGAGGASSLRHRTRAAHPGLAESAFQRRKFRIASAVRDDGFARPRPGPPAPRPYARRAAATDVGDHRLAVEHDRRAQGRDRAALRLRRRQVDPHAARDDLRIGEHVGDRS